MQLTPPRCKCGLWASQQNKNFANENAIIWTCSQGHLTNVSYCSLDDIKLVKELLK